MQIEKKYAKGEEAAKELFKSLRKEFTAVQCGMGVRYYSDKKAGSENDIYEAEFWAEKVDSENDIYEIEVKYYSLKEAQIRNINEKIN